MRRGLHGSGETVLTLFPDQTIVAVVRVVRITKSSVTVFEFEELVAVFS